MKQTTKASIPFKRVEVHQIAALMAAKHGILVYKIPDDTRSFRPFDCFSLSGYPAYVVIQYPKEFYAIDIDVFIAEDKASKRRSLLESRAKEIAAFSGDSPLTDR